MIRDLWCRLFGHNIITYVNTGNRQCIRCLVWFVGYDED